MSTQWTFLQILQILLIVSRWKKFYLLCSVCSTFKSLFYLLILLRVITLLTFCSCASKLHLFHFFSLPTTIILRLKCRTRRLWFSILETLSFIRIKGFVIKILSPSWAFAILCSEWRHISKSTRQNFLYNTHWKNGYWIWK